MKARLFLSSILLCSGPALADVEDDVRCREIAFSQSVEMQDDGAWKVVFDAGNEAAEAPIEEIQALLDREDNCPRSE
jgi:hypothetical protein